MARDINDIERDIERTRRQLAGTLDQIADRTKPANLAEDAKNQVTSKLQDPQVQKVLAGVGAAIAGIVVIAIVRGRRKNKDLKELQRLLSAQK
ncbi:DUF3618 domain-containing protein [Corynebacterium renale]|uniref:Uncharacterized protein DUF3618 n=1 Tax=Corynebacterium renale TaxID=1724 RepID=A0A2A9DPL9_9CORY|nr:DUF3618 domain-containing protein [Corynebacterium renale]PFG28125.1 uncharacterized protein DUF3618 [Corynebacterium renale]SQI20450.1 Protein of uncharacterised function (DUF3618) [Corynebacterium renale]